MTASVRIAAGPPRVPRRDRLKLGFFQRLMTPTEERRFIDGIRALNEGDQDAALSALEEARDLPDAVWMAGMIRLRREESEHAKAHFQHVLDRLADLGTLFAKYDIAAQANLPITSDSRRIVIDTKFTGIVTAGWRRESTLRSGYIYQIYAYLRSQTGCGDQLADKAEGLLLHPAIGEIIDEAIMVHGHGIRFATVDLAGETEAMRKQLLNFRLGIKGEVEVSA